MDSPQLIYEDDFVLALNKPAGMLVHKPRLNPEKAAQSTAETLTEWVLKRYPEVAKVGDNTEQRAGIVHRLDRETSGVIVVAKTQEAFEFLKNQFQGREIKKEYLTLVNGVLKGRGLINKPIGLKPGTVKRTVRAKNMKMVKEAVTEYEVVESFENATLVKVRPRTGRTHQIRVHLLSIGFPVVGDNLYGGTKRETFGLKRQFLHAESLEFLSPNGRRVRVEADLPKELQVVLDAVRSHKNLE
jgi:23S rRNA pseudouridine1911/1915/1917 synthase